MYPNIPIEDYSVLVYCKAKQRFVYSKSEGRHSTDWIAITNTTASNFVTFVSKLKSLAKAEGLDIEVKDNSFRLYEETDG